MFKKLFGSADKGPTVKPPSASSATTTINAIQDMGDKEESLEKRKELLEKRIDAELQKAREYNKAGKKPQALMCLKKKKLLEQEVGNLENMIMRLIEQRNMLEAQRTTVEVVSSMHTAAKVAKSNMKEMNIDKVDEVLDEINETNEQMQQINEVFANPTGLGAMLDEDELLGELEELEALDLDAELLEPAPVPKTKVEGGKMPSAPTAAVPKKTAEELELEALQAEMAM
ncbi:hypothetical protein FOA52_012905 [Chlamydomonas sp. UWO 241]|nr:hypothetical protein FOA52_012905 [Chlamydomonas sp. UWO 241]